MFLLKSILVDDKVPAVCIRLPTVTAVVSLSTILYSLLPLFFPVVF
jgi:hypothetical protein